MKILFITESLNQQSGWGRYSSNLISFLKEADTEKGVLCRVVVKTGVLRQVAGLPDALDFRGNYILFPFYVLKLVFCRKIEKPDIIHCMIETYAPITWLLSKYWGIPYVLTIHGSFGIKTLINPWCAMIQKRCYRDAQAIVAVSNYTKKRLLEKVRLENIVVIPNGVNESFFSIPRTNTGQPIVLGVGALKHRKGFHTVLKAIREVRQFIPSIKYYIVGNNQDVKYCANLRRIIQELDLTETVVECGSIDDAELTKLYGQARLFVLTPISDQYDFEGFGLVYLEASSSGLPVIGTRNSGAEDAIKDGESGFLVSPDNPLELAEKILLVLQDPSVYNKFSQGGQNWAKSMLWAEIVKRYQEVYDFKRHSPYN